MTHKYLILVLFCTWGPPLRFIGCSRMDAKAIVNAICHENSAACLPWFIFCKHIIKDHPAVIGASSSFFPRQCLLWVPAIGWKEGAHIDVYTPPPHFFHALVTCKTEFYFACLIFYSSMEGNLSCGCPNFMWVFKRCHKVATLFKLGGVGVSSQNALFWWL